MSNIDASSEFEALLDYLKRSRGFDFTGYKRASLMRRINKQMLSLSVESYADYMNYLEANPDEVARLLSTLLINVTDFFRDPTVWEILKTERIPQIIAAKLDAQPIRAWSAGCASGEEAFTLAMTLAEALGLESFSQRVKIYATDIDEDALSQARQASYSASQAAEIPPLLLAKYFDQIGSHHVLKKELRRVVIFGRHNLVNDVPISHIDILACRNTLMYFNSDIQAKILARFHFALNDGGCLILGKAETLLFNNQMFTPVNLKRRIFSKVSTGNGRRRLVPVPPPESEETNSMGSVPIRFPDVAFDASPLAQIVLDANGILILANEKARGLFRLLPRDIGRPFRDMELSYRPLELRAFIEKVNTERYPIVLKEIVSRNGNEGDVTFFDVQIIPLPSAGSEPMGVGISFLDVTSYKRLQEEVESSNREIAAAYEEAQSAAEELETTNEELQASAEELETTNEELQSTNEEMETMNEELQSANEELQTMNDELRQRSLELTKISDFNESILGSMRGGIAVVDIALRVETWNHQAEELWGLREAEVIGKNLLSLDIGIPVERLVPQLRLCLAGTSSYEELVVEATNRRGKTIHCRVTCTPLQNRSLHIHGTILVMQEMGLSLSGQESIHENGVMAASPGIDS